MVQNVVHHISKLSKTDDVIWCNVTYFVVIMLITWLLCDGQDRMHSIDIYLSPVPPPSLPLSLYLSLSPPLSLSLSLSLLLAAPPMVLDGSGKEGVRVDTMQDESQQPQQVTGNNIIILNNYFSIK